MDWLSFSPLVLQILEILPNIGDLSKKNLVVKPFNLVPLENNIFMNMSLNEYFNFKISNVGYMIFLP